MSVWLVLFAGANAFAAGAVWGWWLQGRRSIGREAVLYTAWRVAQSAWQQAQIDRDEAIRLGADRSRLTAREAYMFAVIEEGWFEDE